MTNAEGILVRVSNRTYLNQPLTEDEISQLEKMIAVANQASGLQMQLITESPKAFSALRSYGLFSNVRNMVALVGRGDMPHFQEKCGYYGEQIVLGATTLGLGTCWVCGTYDRSQVPVQLDGGLELCGVIAVGPVAPELRPKEKLIRGTVRRNAKSIAELSQGAGDAPDWFQAGISAVQRAPSARNLQAYRFSYSKSGTVTATKTQDHTYAQVDLGIAKLHFEIGAHGGTWTWGDGGTFTKAAEEKSCGAVIWRRTPEGHQYLLAQHGAQHWSFPKGHIEGRETEVETAQREIQEETGLTVKIDTGFRQVVTYYPKPGVIKDVIFFIAQPTGGHEHAQEKEIRQLGWFSFQDAKPLVTFATDVEVLKSAEEYILRQY